MQGLEYEVLNCLIAKSAVLKRLVISDMHNAQEPVLEAIKYTVLKIIEMSPRLTWLELRQTGFDSGDEICAALVKSGISTIVELEIEDQESWFNSDEKCEQWANFISN